MKTENKVLKFNEFINENKLDESKPKKHWDTSILDDNNIELGDMVSSVKEFRTQMDYCLLDLGDGAWRGGYRYKGKKNGKHLFISMLDQGYSGNDLMYSDEELEDSVSNDLWAEEG